MYESWVCLHILSKWFLELSLHKDKNLHPGNFLIEDQGMIPSDICKHPQNMSLEELLLRMLGGFFR